MRRFSLNALEDDINLIFEKLLLETREKQLVKYLWIFKYRSFPRLDSRLFDLALSDRRMIQSATISALALNKDDFLRNLAIKLIQEQPFSLENGLLKLFIHNHQSGDLKILESTLDMSQDIDFKHNLGMDLIKIINTQKTSELVNCCLWGYEHTPCAYCRHKILEILINYQQISPVIIKECLHDCSSKIRDLVTQQDK